MKFLSRGPHTHSSHRFVFFALSGEPPSKDEHPEEEAASAELEEARKSALSGVNNLLKHRDFETILTVQNVIRVTILSVFGTLIYEKPYLDGLRELCELERAFREQARSGSAVSSSALEIVSEIVTQDVLNSALGIFLGDQNWREDKFERALGGAIEMKRGEYKARERRKAKEKEVTPANLRQDIIAVLRKHGIWLFK